MKQNDAWEFAVKSLRLRFLQNNSHIPNIDSWIDEQVVQTLDAIRNTANSKSTESMVHKVEGRY